MDWPGSLSSLSPAPTAHRPPHRPTAGSSHVDSSLLGGVSLLAGTGLELLLGPAQASGARPFSCAACTW